MGNLLSEPKLKGIIDDSQIKTPIYFEGKVKKSLSNNDAVELLPKYGYKWVEAPISSLEKITLLPSANETAFNAKVWLKNTQLSPQALNAQAIFHHLIWDRPSLTPAGQRTLEELSEEERRRRNPFSCLRFVDVTDNVRDQRCAEDCARCQNARQVAMNVPDILRRRFDAIADSLCIACDDCQSRRHFDVVNDCNESRPRNLLASQTIPAQAKSVYSGKEFLQSLSKNSFRRERTFIGTADKFEGNDEALLFSTNLDCASWVKLNLEGIEQIEHLDETGCENHTHPLVSLTLKPLDVQKPSDHLLLKLLNSLLG